MPFSIIDRRALGHKERKLYKSKHQHNKPVAEATPARGLPEMSPRTIGRLLEDDNKIEELILRCK